MATDGGTVLYLHSAKTGAEIYLVGTNHFSAKSAEEVFQVINQVKPDTVAVELCANRARAVMGGKENEAEIFLQTIADLLKGPRGLGQNIVNFAFKSLINFAFASVNDMMRNYGLEPCTEFKVACEEAQKLGANLLCIDRDWNVTTQRMVDVLTFQDVSRLLTSYFRTPELLREFESNAALEEALEKRKTRKNARASTKSFESLFPNLAKVMIHQRDELMVKQLRKCNGKVVSVVGLDHMDGIERLWKQSARQSRNPAGKLDDAFNFGVENQEGLCTSSQILHSVES